MARKVAKKAKTKADKQEAAQAVHDLVGGPRTKPKRRRASSKKWRKQVREMMETEDWDDAKPQHFVALFVILFTWCYEVEPADMQGQELLAARSSARRLLEKEFAGDPYATLAYMKWTWKREKEREEWRRNKGVHGRILKWRDVFMTGKALTEYRIDVARRQHG